jgi:methionine biosynthesis protein MetW
MFLIKEMARVGRKCIISFPNFGFWKVRTQLMLDGRMPKSPRLPYEWWDTPNIHLTTIHDFRDFCEVAGLKVIREIPLRTYDNGTCRIVKTLPNLTADAAIFVVEG